MKENYLENILIAQLQSQTQEVKENSFGVCLLKD